MANELITQNFKVFAAQQFKESLTEPANTIMYLFYGNPQPWADENNPPATLTSVSNSHYETYNQMIGGKQITDTDVLPMVNKKPWANNTSYDMYDDTTEKLEEKDFYVVVSETSNYNVFKCLDNNYGANSVQQPSLIETSANDEVYITESDGYQWKYLYTIPTATYDKFSTASFMPVVSNTAVTAAALEGTLQAIKVTDGGTGYAGYANGFVTEYGVAGDTKLIAISGSTSSLFNVGSTSGFVKEEVITKYVESLLIVSGGTGYSASDTLTINNGGGSTLNATATIASVNATGGITGVSISNRGKSYVGTPTVTITTSTGSSANIISRLGQANGVIVDSNATHLTVSSIIGTIDTVDQIRGVSSNTYANISSVTQAGDSLSSNTDFYKGSSFYVEKGTGSGQLGIIDEYVVTASSKRVLLASNLSTALAADSKFTIGPQVLIIGDGTGAKARAVINGVLNANTVANVQMIAIGNNYSYATVSVQGNTGFVTNAISNSYIANSASCRAIISPKGGHGSDIEKELHANKIGISVTIANTESAKLAANNDFREIGIIKDPLFANGTLVLSSSAGTFVAGESITGATSNATATVVSANASGIAMKDIRGFFTTETIDGNASGNSVVSSVTQPTTVFNQTFKYTANVTYAGTQGNGLIEDERVDQGESLANAHVLITPGSSHGTVELVDTKNTFLISDVAGGDKYITGATSAAQMKITGVTLPEVKKGSGEVIYKENISPVSRGNAQSETFKLILEF